MIISGGENVYSPEIERVLAEHPAVLEVAIIGVPDEQWGESVKAVVSLEPGSSATEDELIGHCREHLAHFKCPRSVDVLDALPRNPTGKILKRELETGPGARTVLRDAPAPSQEPHRRGGHARSMSDHPYDPEAGAPRPTPYDEHPTTPLGATPAGAGGTPPPAAPGAPPAGASRPRRGRGVLAASVVATSLVVGGAAGFGGAAAWDQWHPGTPDTSLSSAEHRTSPVVDTPQQPAADGSVEKVAQQVLPSVVKIDVRGLQEAGSGSGIILSSDGQILTNNHVVEIAGDAGTITVSFNDGSSAPAKILGTDPLTDTAVIQAQDVSGLTPATIGKSSDLRVGEGVVAIGSPFGLESTVTSGIVSALDRPVDVGSDAQGNTTAYPAIQTDAAINPGNSGGPLADMNGHVVGINASIQTTSSSSTAQGGSIGLGFAIPIDEVMPIVDQMVHGETPTHARLGITVSNVASRAGAEVTEGAQVREVANGSTAQDAGLVSGDVITKVDDHQITSADSLVATIRAYRPGDDVSVTYVHDGSTETAHLTLGSDAETSNS
jgi:putative serine protease PepD